MKEGETLKLRDVALFAARSGVTVLVVPSLTRAAAEATPLLTISAEDYLAQGAPPLPAEAPCLKEQGEAPGPSL